ncbi:MAG: HAMP domain-containing protein, partial [Acetatifactor sp.]|nr:HAMP domain-containing protein [Acetatifactor sp.]
MRLKKSIFTKLIGCFILYVIIMVITFALCMLLDVLVMSKGNPVGIYPVGILDENGDVADPEAIQNIGGWVEELDEDYRVVRIYGEKKTDAESYSTDELLALTSAFGQTEYIGFFIQPEDRSSKYLCIYSRDVMNINITLLLNNTERNGALNFSLLFFPISILEIVLISLYLKRKIKNPLDHIIAGMNNLKSGDSGARIQIKTEAEFEKIIDTFNLMAQQLEEEKAKGELLTQKKNRMLLELSHDIRTPIATIKSYANALEEGVVPEEKMQNVYRIIDGKANRVQKLSEDMFMMLR